MGKKIVKIGLPGPAPFLMVPEMKLTARESQWGRAMCKMIDAVRQKIRELAGDSSGVTVVEYAVLLCLLILICVGVIQTLGAWDTAIFAYLASKITM